MACGLLLLRIRNLRLLKEYALKDVAVHVSNSLRRKQRAWGQKIIVAQRVLIKSELESALKEKGVAPLSLALDQVRNLDADLSNVGQLKRYLYVVSALAHHVQYGGLKPRQIQNLFELGYAVLKVQGIAPRATRLGALYGELHLLMSQIHRIEGAHWEAAWEHQVSHHLSSGAGAKKNGFQSLSMAMRSLRLGYTHLAIEEIEKAELLGLSQLSEAIAKLEKLRALRLLGRFSEAGRYGVEIEASIKNNPEEYLEWQWERMCLKAHAGHIEDLVRSTQRNKSHHQYRFVLEAFLWTRAIQSREWLIAFPSLRRFCRNPQLKLKRNDFLYKCTIVLEQCYDYKIPYAVRIRRLGQILSKLSSFPSIGAELLFLASAARWLSRGRTHGFCALVVSEYRALSLRLSHGATNDLLSVAHDIHLGRIKSENLEASSAEAA